MLAVPQGLNYKPFQREAIEQIITRKKILLADEPGLGKTIQAIGAINNTPNINRVLIVCPASVKLNWERELQIWLTKFYNINILYGKAPVELTSPEIIIVNYDILYCHRDYLLRHTWDLLVADECQYLAYLTSKRVGVFSGLGANNILCMSATPADKVIKLWPVLTKLIPKVFNDYRKFLFRYCDATRRLIYYRDKNGTKRTRIILDKNGASHTQELNKILRDKVLIRRFRKDVLDQVPKVQRQIIPFYVDTSFERMKLAELKCPDEVLTSEEQLQSYYGEVKAAIRKKCGIAKLPLIIDFLKGIQHKVVVSAYHREVLEKLHKTFSNSLLIYGGQTSKTKELIKDTFTNSKTHDILFIQSQAGGVGIDGLQKVCNHIVFAEIDWSSDIMEQNEGRLDRIGQEANSILVQYLVADGSIESYIAKKAIQKAQVKKEVLN